MSDANQKDSIQCSSLKWPPLRIHWMDSPNLEPRTHTDPNSDLASEFGKVKLPNSPYGVLNFKTIPKLVVKVSNTSQTSSLPLLFPGFESLFYVSPLYAACAAWPGMASSKDRTQYSCTSSFNWRILAWLLAGSWNAAMGLSPRRNPLVCLLWNRDKHNSLFEDLQEQNKRIWINIHLNINRTLVPYTFPQQSSHKNV